MKLRMVTQAALCAFIALSLAACARSQSESNPQQTSSPSSSPDSKAESCDETIHAKLAAGAGSIKLPRCAGFDMTLQYPAEAARSSRDATIRLSTDNFNNLTPPVNYGTGFLYMSIVTGANRREDHAPRLLVTHPRTNLWDFRRKYVYARYEDGNGPTSQESFGEVVCNHKTCSAKPPSPLIGQNLADVRVDIRFVRDPGLSDRVNLDSTTNIDAHNQGN